MQPDIDLLRVTDVLTLRPVTLNTMASSIRFSGPPFGKITSAFRIGIKPEHLRTNLFTGAATDTIILINMNSHATNLQFLILLKNKYNLFNAS